MVMLENMIIAYHQAREAFASDGLIGVFRERVFWKRIATPAVMDLASINSVWETPKASGFQFFELKLDDIQTGKLNFVITCRYYKALRNFKRGLRCFAIGEGSTIVGDVWCRCPSGPGNLINHPDLAMLGINCSEMDVYAFDMLIVPEYCGKNLAVPLQRFLHLSLKNEGFQKVYAYFWNDKLPALWMHRMVKYQELPKRSICRFFFLHHYANTGSV